MKIYTDGSYRSSKNKGGIGIVWVKDDEIVNTYSKGFDNTTNNKMELLAILIAIRSIKKKIDVTIYTDSMYAIGSISLNWKRKKNIKLLSAIDEAIKSCPSEIKFQHVKGHNGDKYNTMCDTLATQASL